VQHLRIVTVVLLAASATVGAAGPPADVERIRRALEKPAPILIPPALDARPVPAPRAARQAQPRPRSDSIWEGLLIGAAIGGVGGYIWARQICGGTDDTECFLISAPVGIAGGVGIGAAVGAVVDKLHK
jgi:hypothetical protein